MGAANSKRLKDHGFTESKLRVIDEMFDRRNNESLAIEKEVLYDKWRDYMIPVVIDTWINYLYKDSPVLDYTRFSYLYIGQTDKFMEEKCLSIFRVILGFNKDEPVTSLRVNAIADYIRSIISSYIRSLGSFQNADFVKWLKSEANISSYVLSEVVNYLFSDLDYSQNEMVSVRDFEQWLRTKSILANILDGLLDIAYGFVDIGHAPSVLPKPTTNSFPTILDISHIIFLCSHLTKNCTKHWKLVFHNQAHGSNYTLLCKMIVNAGPTIIIIKDRGHHVFGCFASEAWKQSPSFYGDNRCFLFQLSPSIVLLEPSGYNQNFMYHNQNQHTLPNGFGMGGQMGFWGLWLDGDFGKGQCSDFCSTFTNYVRLSHATEFCYTHIEVWSVLGDEDDESETRFTRGRASIIDTDPSAKILIEMAGRTVNNVA